MIESLKKAYGAYKDRQRPQTPMELLMILFFLTIIIAACYFLFRGLPSAKTDRNFAKTIANPRRRRPTFTVSPQHGALDPRAIFRPRE